MGEASSHQCLARQHMDTTDPVYWSSRANDLALPVNDRCEAVYEIFRRFVWPGLTLTDFANLLNRPSWLQKNQIRQVEVFMGKLPVHFNLNGSVYCFEFFPACHRKELEIYIAFDAYVTPERFVPHLFLEQTDEEMSDIRILEIGWCTRDGKWIVKV